MGGAKRSYSANYVILCASLVVVTLLFGVRVKYPGVVYYALAGIQFVVICISAWQVGASAITSGAVEERRLAAAGALLVVSWGLFSFLPGIGPPGDQTHAENALRYLILLVNSIAIAGGLIVLREALGEAGERFYSTLGFGAIMLAAPAYLVWAATAVGYFRWKGVVGSGPVPPGIALMENVLDILLFLGGALTYIATAAFAASLGRTRWLGRTATRVYVTASLFALLCLAVRGLQFPVRSIAMTSWSTIPGFVVGIPAVPWIMPVLFGVVVLRRAGDARRERAAQGAAVSRKPE
jgi:hypothetical protein